MGSVQYDRRGSFLALLLALLPRSGRAQGFTATFETRDVWNGQLNGYTLSAHPIGRAGPKVYRNGILLQPFVDYVLNGQVLTFSNLNTPGPSDVIQAIYWSVG